MTQGIVRVDGASIYYERRGEGPALLLISGGMGEADHYSRVADLLASDYTVLTYDRRGNGRSQQWGPKRQVSVLEQAQDAVAVITANGFESASVFGSSGGALILLELVAAYPEAVSRAIAHEPPIITALPDRGELFDWYDHLYALATEGQTFQAFDEFFQRLGLANPLTRPQALSPDMAEWRKRQLKNVDTLINDEMPVFTYYRPDWARLTASDVPLVITAGHDSLNQHGPGQPVFYAHAAQRVAEQIGAQFVEVPGDHVLYLVDPTTFVETLRPLLRPANDRVPSTAG